MKRKPASDSEPRAVNSDAAPEFVTKFGLQRLLLSGLGLFGTVALFALAGCPANLENAEAYDIPNPSQSSAGSPSAQGGGAAVTPGLNVNTDCLVQIFSSSCSTSTICHKAGATAGAGLDLESPGVNMRLINAAATFGGLGDKSMCPTGAKLIDPANPTASWLLGKLTTDGSTCGAKMPIGAPLTDAQLGCVQKYAQDVAAAATAGSGGM